MSNDLHFAVVVGIDFYPEFRELHSARRDAESFADWLKRKDGGNVPDENVEVIVHPSYADNEKPKRRYATPTSTIVYDQIQEYWEKAYKVIKDDPKKWYSSRLYFYASGHGIGLNVRDAALLAANAGPKNYGENISCQELINKLGRSQFFYDVITIADCCRDRVRVAEPGKPKWNDIDNDFGQPRTLMAFGSEFGGKAYEGDSGGNDDPDEYRSYFTKALLEGLRGGVLANEINERNLADYTKVRLGQLLEGTEKSQRSQFIGGNDQPIVFRKKTQEERMKGAVTVVIQFETAFNGNVILMDGDNEVFDRYTLSSENRTWRIRVPKGGARVVPNPGAEDHFKNGGGFYALQEEQDVIL